MYFKIYYFKFKIMSKDLANLMYKYFLHIECCIFNNECFFIFYNT